MLNARYERVQSDLTHGAPYFLSFLKTNIAVGNHQWQKYIRTAFCPFGKQDCRLSNDATVTLLSARRQCNKLCGRPSQYVPPLQVKFTFDLLTLKVVSESHVTLATSVPILVFLGLSVLDLGPMYATDRQTSDRRQTRFIA